MVDVNKAAGLCRALTPHRSRVAPIVHLGSLAFTLKYMLGRWSCYIATPHGGEDAQCRKLAIINQIKLRKRGVKKFL